MKSVVKRFNAVASKRNRAGKALSQARCIGAAFERAPVFGDDSIPLILHGFVGTYPTQYRLLVVHCLTDRRLERARCATAWFDMCEFRRFDDVLATALLRDGATTDFHLSPLRHEAQFGCLQHDFVSGGQDDASGGSDFDVVSMGLQFQLAAGGDELDTKAMGEQADIFRCACQQFPTNGKLGITDTDHVEMRLRADRNVVLARDRDTRRGRQRHHGLAAGTRGILFGIAAGFPILQITDQLLEFLVIGVVRVMCRSQSGQLLLYALQRFDQTREFRTVKLSCLPLAR